MTKKNLLFASKIIISIAALAFIFSQLDLQSIPAVVSSANVPLIALCFLLTLGQPVINAFKIRLLLPGSGIRYRYILFTNFAANFFRLTIPTDVGAELGRGYYLSRKTGSPATAFSAIVIDRYFGFCTQAFVVAMVSLFSFFSGNHGIWLQVGCIAALVLGIAVATPLILYRMPPIRKSQRKGFVRITSGLAALSDALRVFGRMPLRLVSAGALSIAALCLALFTLVLLSSAFHESLHFREASVITFLSSVAYFLPSLAGLGFVEGIFTGMFSYFDLHKEIGFTVSITLRVFTVLMAIPGVCFFVKKR